MKKSEKISRDEVNGAKISWARVLRISAAMLPGFLLIGGCAIVDEDLDDVVNNGSAGGMEEGLVELNSGEVSGCVAPRREDYIAAYEGDEASAEEAVDAMEHTVLFIVDKSGSMSGYWERGNKWDAAREAMLTSVSMFSHYVSAGAIFFPGTADSCGVEPITSDDQIYFTDGSDFLSRWETSMDNYYPDGSTPLQQAFERADQAIVQACREGIMERPFKVVLITDGEPNCGTDDAVVNAYAAKWLNHGVPTVVIGLPGSEMAEDRLGSIAIAGGTAVTEIDTDVDRDLDSDGIVDDVDSDGSIDTEIDTDTGGVVNPYDEDDLADSIAICIE